MNGNSRNAAVRKYKGDFIELQGQPGKEETLKAKIAADEKGYTPEDVAEIYAAIEGGNEGGESQEFSYIVKRPFACITDITKIYQVGDDVSDFDPERLARLVKNGEVDKQGQA